MQRHPSRGDGDQYLPEPGKRYQHGGIRNDAAKLYVDCPAWQALLTACRHVPSLMAVLTPFADPEELSPIVETEKVAKLALHLCSEAGQIMNGACIVADGGTSAH